MKKALIIEPGIRFLQESGPRTAYFPRGAMSITTFLRYYGIAADFFFLDTLTPAKIFQDSVSIIYRSLEQITRGADYILIAIGGPFTIQYPLIRMLAEMCRELSPRSHITLGGVHVTYTDEASLKEITAADSIIRGEAEWTILELFNKLKDGLPWESVKGITFRRDDAICRTPPREPGDLEELPVLDYGLIPADMYKEDIITMTTSRGCAYQCNFCVEQKFWGNRVRLIPVDKMMAEIHRIRKIAHKPVFSIEDSIFTLNKQHLFEFCSRLKEMKDKDFLICHIMSRVDTVNEESFKAIKEAGIFRVCFGVESFSPKVLKTMNKKITQEQILKACEMARAQGIFVVTLWIFGHPGDDVEQTEITINAIDEMYKKDLHQLASLSMFIPYPGTPVFENPEQFGLKIHKVEWDNWGRHQMQRVCELEDYPTAQLIAEYWKAIEMKKRNENVTVPRYYSSDLLHRADRWKLVIIPTNLATHVIGDGDIDKFWRDFAPSCPDGVAGICFEDNRIMLRIYPENEESGKILQQMSSQITATLGGNAAGAAHSITISETNVQKMMPYPLYYHLAQIAVGILKGD